MSETSVSRVESRVDASPRPTVLVWDAPVRVFHWLMVLSFGLAYLTAQSERWRLLHVTLGYTMVGLVAFRIVWGLVGTRYARFSNFVRCPAATVRYVRTLWHQHPEHHTGHNPAGALSIVALLALTLVVAASGWAVFNEVGGKWLEDAHEAAANVMLAIVGVHIAGVLLASLLHHEKLIGAMISGRKPGRPEEGVRSACRSVAVPMVVAVLAFWWLQYAGAPSAGGAAERPAAGVTSKHGDRDHH